jgi:single-strand DNA-binding protein
LSTRKRVTRWRFFDLVTPGDSGDSKTEAQMSGYMQATLFGRVGRKPELKTPKGGGDAFATFSLAVDRPGERNETDWVDVVCFKKTAELVAEYVEKGDRLLVVGRPEATCYESKGNGWVAQLRCVADRVTFVETKKDKERAGGESPSKASSAKPAGQSATKPAAAPPTEDLGDLPF